MPSDDWQHEMERYLAHFQGAGKRPTVVFSQHAQPSPVWTPALDMYETAQALFVLLDVSGVNAASMEVHVQPRSLTVSGVRSAEDGPFASNEQRSYHTLEIAYGRFARSVELPTGIDTDAAQASYRDGLLEVKLPKRLARQVQVNLERRAAGE